MNQEDLNREATELLVSRITHPALVSGNFIIKHKLANLQRYPYSVLSAEEAREIESNIKLVVDRIDRTLAEPSIDNVNEVLNLKQVRKNQCADPALITRLYRKRLKEGDLGVMIERFKQVKRQLLGK